MAAFFLNLTRAPKGREENDTDAPYLVNIDRVTAINRTPDYNTSIWFDDGGEVIVQESMSDIMQILEKFGRAPAGLTRESD